AAVVLPRLPVTAIKVVRNMSRRQQQAKALRDLARTNPSLRWRRRKRRTDHSPPGAAAALRTSAVPSRCGRFSSLQRYHAASARAVDSAQREALEQCSGGAV